MILKKTTVSLLILSTFLFGCSKSATTPTTPPQPPPVTYTVGQSAFGGLVFYLDSTRQHGLVVTDADLTPAFTNGTTWGCSSADIPGADGTAIGTGKPNTVAIMSVCTSTNIAAYNCASLNLNGYQDWYLPSIGELAAIYTNNNVFRLTGGYWSSTNYQNNLALVANFTNGTQTQNDKNGQNKVRAVRAF